MSTAGAMMEAKSVEDTSRDDWTFEDYQREMQRLACEVEKHDRIVKGLQHEMLKWYGVTRLVPALPPLSEGPA